MEVTKTDKEFGAMALDQLKKLLLYYESRMRCWENYVQILESEEFLFRFNRKWNAYLKAHELLSFLPQDIKKFEYAKFQLIEEVQSNNPRLGQKIAGFVPLQETLSFGVVNFELIKLLNILNKNKILAISYIKTHSRELITWVDSLKTEKDKDEIRRLIIEISGDLLNEFNKCIVDIDRWKDFRFGRNFQFFHHRVIVYLRGGKLENENFLGLVRYFKDKSFIADIKKSQALKMLLTYQRQINFFATQRAIVYGSISRKGWEGFRGKDGFFDNLIKGRNYIETVAETFGNNDIANKLEAMYATTREYPEGWVQNLDSILDRITHPSYQNIHVIIPAANDLIQIFEKRRKELEQQDLNLKLNRLHEILEKIFKRNLGRSRNLYVYQSILNEELTLLRKDIKREKIILKDLLARHGSKVYEFIKEVSSVISSYDSELGLNLKHYLELKMAQIKILESMRGIKGFSDEPKYAVNLTSFFMKHDMKLKDSDNSVNFLVENSLIKSENINTDILNLLKRTKEIKIAVHYVDNYIGNFRNEYFIKNTGMKECTILDGDYVT